MRDDTPIERFRQARALRVLGQIHDAPTAQRKAIIQTVIARVCPAPMTNDERARAADFVLAHVDDPDAVALVDRLDRFDAETRSAGAARRSRSPASVRRRRDHEPRLARRRFCRPFDAGEGAALYAK